MRLIKKITIINFWDIGLKKILAVMISYEGRLKKISVYTSRNEWTISTIYFS